MVKIMNKAVRGMAFFALAAINFSLVAKELVQMAPNKQEPIKIEVYRSPTCGCCGKWIKHLQENNFAVKDFVTNDVQAIKDKYGVPEKMASCHTALVDGYVIEGHVPISDILKLIKEKSEVIGISVPGMTVGSPGMEMGGKKDPYQVVSFDKENNFQVVKSYGGN